MAEGLTGRERYLQRIQSLALSALPVTELPMTSAAPQHHDGVMVALVPDNPEDLAVEDEGALPADDLHVTFCYFGKVQDLSTFDQTRILNKTRSVVNSVGKQFEATPDGVVVMGQNEDGVPATAMLIQSDEIVSLYDALVEALDYESKFPSYIPHMTMGYGTPVEAAQKNVGKTVPFNKVIVKFGDVVHDVPLPSAMVAAPQATNTIDRVIDSLGRLWDEALHPRDGEGRFIKKNGAVSGKLAVPTRDRKSVNMVDANRASVVGFHTFGDEVWVLAEITNDDGSKQQGFARATSVRAVAPVKARLDALYPIGDERGGAFLNSSLERKRQLDLLAGYINAEYGNDDDDERAVAFLETLGLWEKDLDYLYGGGDPDYLGGLRRPDGPLSDDEMEEAEDIVEDARQVKTLRDRVHSMKNSTTTSDVQSADDLMKKYDELGVDSFVSEKDDKITLSKVVVDDRSQGTGSAFMKDLTDYADRTGKRIDLTPSSDFGGSKPRLVEFYKRFGFVENKGKNKDYEVSETMYRLPEDSAEVDGPDFEPHVQPQQQLLQGPPPDPEAVAALQAGADPLSLSTDNLLGAMEASGRFTKIEPTSSAGTSPIEWHVDPSDDTGHQVRLAGTDKTTTDRAYFVKQSIVGAEFDNTDIVKEVLASLITEQVADDERSLRIPKSRFGDNPVWDGETPHENLDIENLDKTHQPAHIVSEHAGYHVPEGWITTDMAAEEVRLQNDIRALDDAGKVDAREAFFEDTGDIFGNDIAKMVLWDYAVLNGDRNPGNAFFAFTPDNSQTMVVPIDHGFAFDEPDLVDDFHGDPNDAESTFEWFMNYKITQGWMNYVLGGLDIGNNVSEETLRSVLDDFIDTYGRLDAGSIMEAFRAMPGVTDDQIQKVEKDLDAVLDRIRWVGDNTDAVLRRLTERRTS